MNVWLKKLTAIIMPIFLILSIIPCPDLLETYAYDQLIRGIDISEFQTVTNWNSVADSVDFVIIRVGTTTGLNNDNFRKDKKFESHYEGARSAGLPIGIYYYSGANTLSGFQKNATECVEYLNGKNVDYPVYLDVEQSTGQMSLGKSTLTSYILSALKIISNAGYKAGVYANQDWFNNYVDGATIRNAGYSTWLARYPSAKYAVDPSGYDYSANYDIWQYASVGQVSGIAGNVDVDVSYTYFENNQHPIGYLDSYGTDGRNVNIYGWTFDPSSPSSQLAVHIYLRDSDGGMHCVGALTADQNRPDVNNVYGCGEYHGYDGSVSAAGLAAGDYTVQVAFLDVEDDGNGATWVSGGTVTINPDSEGPSISDVKIVDISKDGYTVQCTAEDSSSVNSVRFPTWTDHDGQDDIIWGEGTAAGNVWSYRVDISDHNNERGAYTTHIYAYDNAGNQNAVGTSAYLEDIAPKISDVTVCDISASGYTVKCTVTDEGGSGVDRVQFPTWTLENDQDDIQHSWQTNQTASGTIDGDTVTFRVNISDHNNEIGCYRTHIYAYDKSGNASCVAVDDVFLENVPPTISDVKIIDIDDAGYTVQCTVTDDGTGVDHVAFPTWTISKNGQDDLQSGWEQSDKCAGTVGSDGKTYTYRVNISDHNNENGCYRTHIYAWDKSGNMAYHTDNEKLNYVMFDDDNQVIYNIKISNIDKTGYTISCDIRADINVDRVQFPTWTDLNGQDDIQTDWTESEKSSGTPTGNKYVYRVKASDHNNELGPYITHIYAYDTDGNYYHVSTGMDAAGLYPVTLNGTIEMPSGDVNCDGRFNVSDVVLFQKWLLAVPDTHLDNWQAANFCEDDRLDVFDLCLMKRKLIYG